MFDIGFFELLIVSSLFLVVVGPERFPEVARNSIKFMRWIKNVFDKGKAEVEKTIGLQEIKQDIYNQDTLKEINNFKDEMQNLDDQNQKKDG
ncbi:MAG: Sec-independent protein translocase protein TatB [SAR86 cluster bacterium]|jgi:sec-independent protein translocase protein TatB|nr:Sec-independent protein translocase protein TatB [SAR86 cluster bacterium]|tara:strand:- start:2244 stop:2519 length:276 start_codon:yes stop_codon:yes gene_type:complete